MGACVQLAIKVYKDGKEIKFNEEPHYENFDLTNIYSVTFDRKDMYIIQKNIRMDNLFRILFGWEKIESEVVGYTLHYLDVMLDELIKEMPEQFKDIPCASPMEVSEEEIKGFLSVHIEDFDIPNNVKAQVPSVSFI